MSDFFNRLLGMMFSLQPGSGVPETMGEQYNTQLAPGDVEAFNKWIEEESSRQGRNLLLDIGDYDVQGYWAAGERPDERGHGTDRFKKPNHPTFSDESIYHGTGGNFGGQWGDGSFTPGRTNMEYFTPEEIMEYFKRYEPDVMLNMATMIPK